MAAGALLARTFANLRALDPGFAAEGLTLVELDVPYPFAGAPPDLADRFRRVSERLAALPGIEGATPAYNAPLAGTGGISFPARAEGQTSRRRWSETSSSTWSSCSPAISSPSIYPSWKGGPSATATARTTRRWWW